MNTKKQLTEDILQQVQHGIEDVLLMHAPDHWQDEECDAVEKQALQSTRRMLAGFGIEQLRSIRAVPTLRAIAATETMRIIELSNLA